MNEAVPQYVPSRQHYTGVKNLLHDNTLPECKPRNKACALAVKAKSVKEIGVLVPWTFGLK